MKYGRYYYSYIFLRLGLGLVFLWIGVDMFRSPDAWIGFLPQNIPFGFSTESSLQLIALFDVALGLLLLTGSFIKIVALVAALHLIGIIVVNGIDGVIIRDVGLLGASLSLFFWPNGRRKFHWKFWQKKKKKSSSDEGE